VLATGGTDWGDVPAWLALIAGLIAVLTFVAGRLDARRAHAAQVFAVLTDFRLTERPEFEGEGHVTVTPTNYGPAPIFDAGVYVHEFGRRHWLWRMRRSTDWWTGEWVDGAAHGWTTIKPQSEGEQAVLPAPTAMRDQPQARPHVILSFRDGNGRRWVRWPDGKLQSAALSRRWPI
jgi:hypothetical protein